MSSGLAIAALPRAPVIELFPTLEPYLVEVIIPFSTGTVDEAVRQSAIIAQNAVDAAFNAILGNAPTVLDTLKEIDDAIGNDPNFATTILTALATKLVKTANLSDLSDKIQARANLGVPYATADAAQAGTDTASVMSPALVAGVLQALLTQPNVLASLLPTALPSQTGVPWNNNGTVSIS